MLMDISKQTNQHLRKISTQFILLIKGAIFKANQPIKHCLCVCMRRLLALGWLFALLQRQIGGSRVACIIPYPIWATCGSHDANRL